MKKYQICIKCEASAERLVSLKYFPFVHTNE